MPGSGRETTADHASKALCNNGSPVLPRPASGDTLSPLRGRGPAEVVEYGQDSIEPEAPARVDQDRRSIGQAGGSDQIARDANPASTVDMADLDQHAHGSRTPGGGEFPIEQFDAGDRIGQAVEVEVLVGVEFTCDPRDYAGLD